MIASSPALDSSLRRLHVRSRLPMELPPSFCGSLVRSEYTLIVSLCTKAPPRPGLLASMLFSSTGEWRRGPVHRVCVPVHVVCGAAYVRAAPTAATPARCRLALVERAARACAEDEYEEDETEAEEEATAAAASRGEGSRVAEDEEDEEDEEHEEHEDEDEDEAAAYGARLGGGGSSLSSYEVQLGGPSGLQSLARVQLTGTCVRVGGVVRGAVEIFDVSSAWSRGGAHASVERLEVALVLLEQAESLSDADAGYAAASGSDTVSNPMPAPTATATASSTVVARTFVDGGTTRRATFELGAPVHAPPTTALWAAGLTVRLAYELRITFELRGGQPASVSAGAAGAEPPTTKLPWRLPIRLLPTRTRGRRAAATSARTATASMPIVTREVVLNDES